MTYKGGKAGSGVYQQIINQIPPHEVYIEPFLGGGAVLLHKRAAAASIVLDVDAACGVAVLGDGALPGVTFINGDAISYLQKLRCERSTFVYCDPPYLMETRSSKRSIYKFEFAEAEQHAGLLRVLQSLPCMVAISGYWSYLYESMLHDWRSISYNAVTRSGKVAREFLWMNYPEPVELHDYHYLGQNFREREKITRQKRRWRARLLRMSQLQRYALLSSIAELDDARASLDPSVPAGGS
jgi:DNA adenine methylase